jgi:hypothetical protein
MSCARSHFTKSLIVVLSLFFALPPLCAQEKNDVDPYKWRVDAMWWFSHPTGSFHASTNQVSWDLSKDFGFGSYSTFSGVADWHFKRKHHFILTISPLNSTKSASISRDITFQGVTYQAGATVSAQLDSLAISPGYQYDIFRKKQGYLALVVALNMLDTTGKLTGTGTLNGVSATRTASGSVFAPLPVLGPKFRWYPIHDSNRLSLEGAFTGMYFFGYGNFIYTAGSAQVKLHKNLALRGGYQLGTRFSIQGKNNNIGLRLTQTGPVAGLEAHW